MNRDLSRRSLLKIAGAVGVGAGVTALGGVTPVAAAPGQSIAHPGMLHAQADLDRMAAKVRAGAEPYRAGWQRLEANRHAQASWKANPQETVYRGGDSPQNVSVLFNDVHAAYQNALRWRISGEQAYGDAARDILNAWSGTLRKIEGNADRFLAAGIQGYQFANAAELMRGYPGFDLGRFKTMMLEVFYPLSDSFLTNHNGAFITNYWANWDLMSMCNVLAIGILCDDRAKIERAVEYFKHGEGNGAIGNAVPYLHPGGLGQFQESGRDQGHTLLAVGLMATFCEMAWNQGYDLYGYDDNRFLKGAEYAAKYNLGEDVPFTPLKLKQGAPGVWSRTLDVPEVSPAGRGHVRPIWAMVQNHYVNRKGLAAPYVTAIGAKDATEGGGGDYGPNSGGFDQLGFGTLAFTRDRATAAASATATAAPSASASAGAAASSAPAGTADATSAARADRTSPGAAPVTSATPAVGGDLANTGANGVVPMAATGLLAIGGGLLALRMRGRRRGTHRL